MTQQYNLLTAPIHPAQESKRMLQGAGIAFILISLFLLSAAEPDPGWPKSWMIRPLVTIALAGSFGGVFYYFMDYLWYRGGWRKILSIVVSVIGYLIVLWLGTVLAWTAQCRTKQSA